MEELSQRNTLKTVSSSLQIAKIPLCLLVAFSAFFGYIFGAEEVNSQAVVVFISILFLACGGASFNSFQERYRDGLMARTEGRPLVQGKLSSRHAIIQSQGLIFVGLVILYIFSNTSAFLAGLLGIAIYNLIYTRMKSWSVHAIFPGALCGAVPPYVGWLAAGAEPASFKAMLLILLLIFWQIPHFFLVMLNHKSDYLKSMTPNMLKCLREPKLQKIFLPWIAALAATMITFSVWPSYIGTTGRVVIVINAIVLLFVFYYQLLFLQSPNYKRLFKYLNISLLLIMMVVCFAAVDFPLI